MGQSKPWSHSNWESVTLLENCRAQASSNQFEQANLAVRMAEIALELCAQLSTVAKVFFKCALLSNIKQQSSFEVVFFTINNFVIYTVYTEDKAPYIDSKRARERATQRRGFYVCVYLTVLTESTLQSRASQSSQCQFKANKRHTQQCEDICMGLQHTTLNIHKPQSQHWTQASALEDKPLRMSIDDLKTAVCTRQLRIWPALDVPDCEYRSKTCSLKLSIRTPLEEPLKALLLHISLIILLLQSCFKNNIMWYSISSWIPGVFITFAKSSFAFCLV